jgi:hypothetical protein
VGVKRRCRGRYVFWRLVQSVHEGFRNQERPMKSMVDDPGSAGNTMVDQRVPGCRERGEGDSEAVSFQGSYRMPLEKL